MARQAAGMSGFDFSNAMVVVTGAGAGIGQGIAQKRVCGALDVVPSREGLRTQRSLVQIQPPQC
jgi:NAD(P)-dependent dehydrogenase (short-subunit alcohol dehydrogenase family)